MSLFASGVRRQWLTVLLRSNTSSSIVARKKAAKEVIQHAKIDGDGTKEIAEPKFFPKNVVVDKEALNNSVNTAIQAFFQSPPETLPQAALDQLIKSSASAAPDSQIRWTTSNIATLMFTAAKQKKSFSRKDRRRTGTLTIVQHIPRIVEMLEDRKDEIMGNRDISNLCYGLKALKSATVSKPGNDQLIAADSTEATVSAIVPRSSSLVTLSPPIAQFLNILADRLDNFTGKLTKVDFGKMMYGLQGKIYSNY